MVTARKPGPPPDPRRDEYMRRYAISRRQLYTLGGPEHFDAMTEDARQVLVNRLKSERKGGWRR